MINDVNISQLFERNTRTAQPVTLGTLHFGTVKSKYHGYPLDGTIFYHQINERTSASNGLLSTEIRLLNKVKIAFIFTRVYLAQHTVKQFFLPAFLADRIITDNINVGGRIQEVNVADELIRTFSPDTQTIRGRKSFTGPVQTDSLQVGNLINGMDPVLLCEDELESEPQTAHWTIEGNTYFKYYLFHSNE